MRTSRRDISRWLLAGFFVLAGLNHFRDPAIYLSMMPPWLPWPREMNLVSGAAELLGGIGILHPFTRRAAGWGLVLLLLAVFPANVHVAVHGWPGVVISPWVLWGRLPFQLLFLVWVYQGCRLGRP